MMFRVECFATGSRGEDGGGGQMDTVGHCSDKYTVLSDKYTVPSDKYTVLSDKYPVLYSH
jgi:hypothetical protein